MSGSAPREEGGTAADATLYQDRRRAESFGAVAASYDRFRPSYPAALVDDLMAGHPVGVLDVGCGTGKVSRLFLERGCHVLGVEVDPRMAAFARSTGVAVEVGRFERWEPGDRIFDLLVSGQAWHWVEPHAGAVKAGVCIRPAGRFAVFWNHPGYSADVLAVFSDVYGELAPELRGSHVLGTGGRPPLGDPGEDPVMRALLETGAFESPERRRYHWERHYRAEEWLGHLRTSSDHLELDERRLADLVDALERRLLPLGDGFAVTYDTEVLTAVRR